jgi:hypothetical protein
MWESENQDESPLMTTDNFHGIDRLVPKSNSAEKTVPPLPRWQGVDQLSQNGFDASNPAGGEFAPAKWGTSRGQFWPSAPHAGAAAADLIPAICKLTGEPDQQLLGAANLSVRAG